MLYHLWGLGQACTKLLAKEANFEIPHAALGQVVQKLPNGKITIRIVFFEPKNPKNCIFSQKTGKKNFEKNQKGTYPLWSENSKFCFGHNFFSKKAILLL